MVEWSESQVKLSFITLENWVDYKAMIVACVFFFVWLSLFSFLYSEDSVTVPILRVLQK